MASRSLKHAVAMSAAVAGVTPFIARAADAPVLSDPSIFVNLLRLPNGNIQRVVSNGGFIKSQTSTDSGATWGPTVNFTTALSSSNPTPLVDSLGETHFFQFVLRDTNGTAVAPNTPLVDRFLDIWQTRSANGGTTWNPAQSIFQGYNGSMMRVIQLSRGPNAGRIVLPFSNRVTNDSASPTGLFVIRGIYSDDMGTSWQVSPSVLTSTVPTDWNGSSDGAAEPTFIQLNDNSIKMYARSQVGFLTESASTDGGATWAPLKNSNFYTSTGPPNTIRLDDGRLMLFWNNATMPQRYNGAIWYAGRDVLHAAISSDEGKTWSGYREIYLDPARNNAGISTGDTGTAYPFPVATPDGKALVITGQSTAKTQLKIDPNWLMETTRSEDFTGADPLSDWSTFKSFGAVTSVKRDRTAGAALVFDAAENKNVMTIRRPDANDPDGATWNFPMAKKGETELRIKLEPGFQGGSISLGDHFYQPTDIQGEQAAVFKLDISPSGVLSSGGTLAAGSWADLTLQWDISTHKANVLLNGSLVGQLDQRTLARPGASYLRLRSSATTTDLAGMKISTVNQAGMQTGVIQDALLLGTIESTDALVSAAGWTRLRYDNYAPNTAAINGLVLSATGYYTGFVQPTTAAAPADLLVDSSIGRVDFNDLTSAQVTSDINGPKNGDSITFTFVDKTNIARKAAVTSFAFRFGSTVANNVEMKLLDINGNEIPNYTTDFLTGITTGGVLGATALSDLESASIIHQVVFTGLGSDVWVLGSFASDPAQFDLAYTGLAVKNAYLPSQWKPDANGTWTSGSNWTLGRPNNIGAIANFTDSLTQPRTVTVDASQKVGTINFDGPNAYTIAGNSTLSMEGFSQSSVNVLGGNHVITAPLQLTQTTTFDIGPAAASLNLTNLLPTSSEINKDGLGTLQVSTLRSGSLHVNEGALRLTPNGTNAATSIVSSLSIESGAALDLADNSFIVNYTGTSPLSSVIGMIADQSLFTTSGTSNTAIGFAEANDLGLTSFGGEPVDSTAILIRLTLRGDSNLDGNVNFDDLLRLAQFYQSTTNLWSHGDFDGNGTVDFGDLLVMAQNYNQSTSIGDSLFSSEFATDWILARSLVPEPTSLATLFAWSLPAVLRRRR